jgi:hypothetical protein
MKVQQDRWHLSKFQEASGRMTFHHGAVLAVDGVSSPDRLRAADVVIGEHRTRRQARRWVATVYRRYPHCLLAVARHRRGRWCVIGLPARDIVLRGGRFELSDAEELGRLIYRLWSARWTRN